MRTRDGKGHAAKASFSKTPRLGRYEEIRRRFENDLFNNNKRFVDTRKTAVEGETFNFVDLFAGAGGMSLGFTWANYRPLVAVEVEPDACATHRRNFPDCALHGELIETLSNERLLELIAGKTVHVVCGGPPCQGFSVAGKRDINDQRNTLFREFVRVVEVVKPWFVVLENVPGILTMGQGAVYQMILEAFAKVGYPDMAVAVLETAAYGVPQIRPRAIFIGNRFGLTNPFPMPRLREDQYLPIEAAIEDLMDRPPDPALNHEWTRHSEEMELRIAKVPPGGSLYDSYVDAWKRQYPGLPSMTIKENHGGSHLHPHRNRVLSAREMARLQSFPDDFIFASRMKRVMWQVGNAVPPVLAKEIGLALRPDIEEISAAIDLNASPDVG